MDLFSLAAPLAIICAIYAAQTGLSWLRRVQTETRRARRKGMLLNLFRRAAPPTSAGLLLLIAGLFLYLADSTALGALLISGGLAYAFHRGLADLGPINWREHGLRLALTISLSLFAFWQLNIL